MLIHYFIVSEETGEILADLISRRKTLQGRYYSEKYGFVYFTLA